MKKLLLLALFLPLFALNLKADLGSCVVYHAKFYLKNGTVFNGSFETFDYNEGCYLDENGSNKFCNDKGVFYVLKQKQRNNGYAEVFKNLHYFQPRPIRKQPNRELPNYGFVCANDVVLLDSNDISKLVFWSAEYSKRYWLTSALIFGTSGMLDTIKHQKYWNHLVFATNDWEKDTVVFQDQHYIDGALSGFAVYNYNAQINIAELKRLIHLKFPINYNAISQEFRRKYKLKEDQLWTPETDRLYNKLVYKKIQAIQDWFWKKGILVVPINGTC